MVKNMMRAMQITAPGAFEIIEVETPAISDDELLMKIEAVTTCPRWDLYMFAGKDVLDRHRQPEYPLAPGWPGHETAGTVVEVGSKVTRFKAGDRIAAHAAKLNKAGEAGYAEYMKFTENEVEPMPSGISFEEAAPFELLKCVVKGMNQFASLQGKTIAVNGLGPAGLLAVQIAKIWGAETVFGVDVSEQRLAYAEKIGGCTPLHADELSSQSFDLGFDCVGHSAAVQNLVDHAKQKVVIFGVLQGDVRISDEHWKRAFRLECFDTSPLTRKELDLSLEALAHPGINMKSIITHHGTFENYHEAIERLKKQEAIKVCFFPAKEFADN